MSRRTVAIMQPSYLPWMGYFDMMDQCDLFVLLDCVQFDKRSWQRVSSLPWPIRLSRSSADYPRTHVGCPSTCGPPTLAGVDAARAVRSGTRIPAGGGK